jgi:hypothetical protein
LSGPVAAALGLAERAATPISGMAPSHERLLMPSIANADVKVAIAVVAVVLTYGLAIRLRQGSPDAPQRLMRWRIALLVLGVVVIVVMLAPLAP